MYNNLTRKRPNKLLTPRRNYFLSGGYVGVDTNSIASKTNVNTQLVGTNSNGSFDTKGNSNNSGGNSGGSNAIGLAGGIASIGVQAASDINNMITNLKGNNIKEDADNRIDAIRATQQGPQSSDDNFDALASDMTNYVAPEFVTKEDMGYKSGWDAFGEVFGAANQGAAAGAGLGPWGMAGGATGSTLTSIIGLSARNKHAKEQAERVNAEIRNTVAFNQRSFSNRASNLIHNQLTNLEANYGVQAAYGGMLHAFGGELNTQGGDFTNGLLYIDNGGSHEANPYEGVPMGMDPEGTPNLVEEGETIFNDYVFSKRLKVPKAVRDKYKLRGTKSLSFAEASKKLAKESEERPNDPISMRGLEAMMANLASAQEGLKASKRDNSFAYGGKVNKFSGEEPYTPSTINRYSGVSGYYGLGDTPFWIKDGSYIKEYEDFINDETRYGVDQFRQHLKNQFAYYDDPNVDKTSKRYKAIKNFIDKNPEWYNNRGSIDTWNISGKLMKQARRLALSNPGFMHPEDIARAALADKTATDTNQAPAVINTAPTNSEVATKPIPRNWVSIMQSDGTYGDPILYDDAMKQGLLRGHRRVSQNDKYGENGIDNLGYYDPFEEAKQGKYADWLRYAPAVGLGIGALTDAIGWTNKPDYGNANAILEAAKTAGKYQPVKFKPIGNYLTYRPFDRNWALNKLNAEAGAARRSLLNTSGGNRATAMAGILAANNNYMNQIGNLTRQAEEYNLAQRHQVEEFNRGTNTTNSQGFLQADIANQKALMNTGELYLKGAMAAAEMKEKARLTSEANKSNNISGFFSALGDIGFDEANRRMADNYIMSTGIPGGERFTRGSKSSNKKQSTKSAYPVITPGGIAPDKLQDEELLDDLLQMYNVPMFYAANGGKLNMKRKRKRGLTV